MLCCGMLVAKWHRYFRLILSGIIFCIPHRDTHQAISICSATLTSPNTVQPIYQTATYNRPSRPNNTLHLHSKDYMANGGSPLPAPRSTPSSLPAMPFAPKSSTSAAHQMLHPHQNSGHRQSTETLTSISTAGTRSSTSQNQSPHRSRRTACTTSPNPSNDDDPELSPKSHAPHARFRQVLGQHHHHGHPSSSPSPPPMRDLPALRPTYEALLGQHAAQPVVQADQLEEISPDAEMILASLYGFPYCVPVPDALEQRSRAIAEAEELEYRQRKGWKQRARLSGRVEAALKGLSLPGSRSRSRTDRKF